MIWAYLTLVQVLSMAFRTRIQSNQVMPLSNHGSDNDDSADITDSSSGALKTPTGPKERLGRIDSILLTCNIYYRASFARTKIIYTNPLTRWIDPP